MDFNIATSLSQMAEAAPFQKAVIFPANRDRQGRVAYTHLTYAQLEEASQIVARGLLAHGIGYGIRVAFLVKPSLEFFILTFALYKAKAIPVFIDPGLGLKAMRRCLAEAKAEAFIGSPLAHAARILFGWRGGGWKKKFLVSHLPWPGTINFIELKRAGERLAKVSLPMAEPNELAAILFTSGSTGAPKGAMYTHGNFHAQVRLLKESLEIRPGEIDLSTFPLFCLLAPALGITSVIPEMNFTRPARVDPEKIAEAIRNFGVTTMFGSPALLKTVAQYGVSKNWQFPSLRRVISAGAPVPAAVISQFRRMLDKSARFYTPYGATEALPIAVAESETILGETAAMTEQGHGICIGTVTPRSDVRIIRITDEALDNWEDSLELSRGSIGEIAIAGEQVTRSYYKRPEDNRLSKIYDGKANRFFHRLGDLGYFDSLGRLWFCGRKSDRVQTREGLLHTVCCEGIFNKHPLVSRTALVGIGVKGSERPLLCIEPSRSLKAHETKKLLSEIKRLGSQYEQTQKIQLFLIHENFPVDIRHNAKIFREKLKVWAEAEWQKKYSSAAEGASSAKP